MSDENKEEQNKKPHGWGEGQGNGDGYTLNKKSLALMAGGALGALAAIVIGKASKRVRPAVVGAVKEGYAFKEWVAAKVESAKEDVEDVVAEAKHAYHKDLEATASAIEKEKEFLRKAEEAVARKMAREKSAGEEQ